MSALLCKQHLEKFDFDVDKHENGLVFVDKQYMDDDIAFNERLEIDKAKEIGANAVYFRRFDDGRNSIAQIYIFDNTNNKLDLVSIHKKLWSGSIVPIYYVFSQTEVVIRSAREHINKQNEEIPDPIKTLDLVNSVQSEYEKYSASMFQTGDFWNTDVANDKRFGYDKTAGNILIQELENAREDLGNKLNTDRNTVNHLLMVSIFVKYLEERKGSDGSKVLPEYFFRNYCNKNNKNDSSENNFCAAIRSGKIINVLDKLGEHFNGKVFNLNTTTKKAILGLETSRINELANFLDAKIEGTQYSFWRLYDFNYIPVELISRIYEELMPQNKGVVYTPIHLANLIVDECMPLNNPKPNIKICDPSCGSGIFLVTAFRRLVEWCHKQEYDKTGDIDTSRPNANRLKKIMEDCIYGVDKEDMAIKLTVFSLSIAICDMLTPTQIWSELKFGDLGKNNLNKIDFFEYIEKEKESFDLIIGNPPFGNSQRIGLTNKKMSPVPRNESSLLFLKKSMDLLKLKGNLAFIVQPVPLLYYKDKKFRNDFFSKYRVQQIIDFSLLRGLGVLFGKTVSTIALFVENTRPSSDEYIQHIVVNRTVSAKEKILFEIDKYDCHAVPLYAAINDRFVWKTNIMGGGGIYDLVKRYKSYQTFKQFLDMQKKQERLFYREGYTVGSRTTLAKWITGALRVVKLEGNRITETVVEEEKYFQRTRKEDQKIFESPHLLIRENIRNGFHIAQDHRNLRFRDDVIGIHATKMCLDKIEKIFRRNSHLYQTFLLATSHGAGISRSGADVVIMDDIMNLPFPADGNDLPEIMDDEKIIIDDVLEYGVERLNKHEKAPVNTKDANDTNLKQYSKVFCRYLNRMYAQDDKKFHPDWVISESQNHICVVFRFCDKNTGVLSEQDKKLLRDGKFESLMTYQQSESAKFNRIIKWHGENIVYFIKPKTLRYWLRSIALRDAAEIMSDLIASGH